jgi:drug/metabolite transporter (DMT)-like permease
MGASPEGGRGRGRGYLMVVLAALLFGFNGNLARKLFDAGVTPLTLVECRMVIGGLFLLGCLLVGQRITALVPTLRVPVGLWGWLLALGLTMAAVTYTYFMAVSRLPIAVALVVQFSTPAWLVLGEALWRRRMPSGAVLVALLLALSGLVLVTGVWRQRSVAFDPLGLLFALLSVLTFAAYLLLGRRVGRELPALPATTWGALVAALFWLVVQPPWRLPALVCQAAFWPAVLAVGILGMALPFFLELAALRYLDAARTGITAMLELVAGSCIAYLWLGQALDLWEIAGSLLVMSGVALLHVESLRHPEGAADGDALPRPELAVASSEGDAAGDSRGGGRRAASAEELGQGEG